jgi:flagellar biosynthetic protein FlhB
MAEGSNDGDKKHEPTPWRLEKARREGESANAKSQDLASAIILLLAILLLMTFGQRVATKLFEFTHIMLLQPQFLSPEHQDSDAFEQSVHALFHNTIIEFMIPMSVFFLLLLLTAILANVFQIGFHWLPEKLAFDITRLDPIKGFGRIFSWKSLVRFLLGVLKILIASAVAWYAVVGSIGEILNLPESETAQIASFLVWTLLLVALKVAIALVIIALIDLLYQRWKYYQDLRMTDQQLREEYKQNEGDPEILQKRKQFHRELVKNQQVQGTQEANVVVTNPTHFSVAIKFDIRTMSYPVVVAKGADILAFQIREVAAQHRIPIVRRPVLARTLYDRIEIGQQIMIEEEHMNTLAEVLGFAYRLTGRS